jgi:DNA-binding NarL/FixJ family response regulator
MHPIRLVIVDDHRMFADGLRLVFDVEHDIKVVRAETNGTAGIQACKEEHPDVVLVDGDLPDMDGLAAVSAIAANSPATNVVMVTGTFDREVVSRAIDAGVVGFVSKQRAAEELVHIIRLAARGHVVVSDDVAAVIPLAHQPEAPDADLESLLSGRELDVLQGITDGLSTSELARELFVSPRTIQGHVQNIITKLEVRSKLEAVLRGLHLGIVRLGSPRRRTG